MLHIGFLVDPKMVQIGNSVHLKTVQIGNLSDPKIVQKTSSKEVQQLIQNMTPKIIKK